MAAVPVTPPKASGDRRRAARPRLHSVARCGRSRGASATARRRRSSSTSTSSAHRIFIMLGAILVGVTVAFVFHKHILHWLNASRSPRGSTSPITLSVSRAVHDLALGEPVCRGAGLAMPVILWQVWAFFVPAMEDRHSAHARLATSLLATVLLAGGIFFGYYVVLPAAARVLLTNYNHQLFNIQIRAKDYYGFVTMVMPSRSAIVFELPIFVLAARPDAGSSRRSTLPQQPEAWATSSSR